MMKRSKLLKIAVPLTVVGLAGAGVGIFLFTDFAEPLEGEVSGKGGLSGVVVDGLTDQALSGATVMARRVPSTPNMPREGVTANEKGRFVIALADGDWQVTPSFPGYVTKGRADEGRLVSVSDGTQYVNAKLMLWPAAGIRGRIVAGDVGIRANLELSYDNDASDAEGYTFKVLTTDDDGNFVIDGAYAGSTTLTAAAEGFANVALTDIELSFGQMVDLGDIPMRDGVSLYGRVTDVVSQTGIAGAQVMVKNANGDVLESVLTEFDGDYRLPPLDMGQVSVHIAAEGYHALSHRMKLSGNANREMNIALKRSWGLTLDVQNMTGREPIQTHVKIVDVTSDASVYAKLLPNGKVTLEDLKGGPFLVTAESHDRLTTVNLRVMAGDQARVVLKPFARVEGTARKSDGTPLEQGEYRYAFKPELTAEESVTPWYALASSEFEIPDLPEGYYRIEVRKGADDPASSPVFQLRHGDVRHVVVQQTEGGVLKGHVVTTESGFGVRAQVNIDGTSLTANTDRDGYFTIDKLPSYPFTVMIKPMHETEYTKFEGIVVKDNTTLEREFRVVSARTEEREKRRQEMEERRARGEMPPWPPGGPRPDGEGRPPWGDGPPPWANGEAPPWGDGPPPWVNGEAPPWGDGPPPWMNGALPGQMEAPPNKIGDQPELPMNEDGTLATPPWEGGKPPWGDGPPPWEVNGGRDIPPPGMQMMPFGGDA